MGKKKKSDGEDGEAGEEVNFEIEVEFVDGEDEEVNLELEIAGGCLWIRGLIDQIIEDAEEEDELMFHHKASQSLADIADAYWPPGYPEGGYQESNAEIINLDQFRSRAAVNAKKFD